MPQFVSESKVLVGLSTILMLIVGWLFGILVDIQRDTKAAQIDLVERVAIIEAEIKNIKSASN